MTDDQDFIPVCVPLLAGREQQYVMDAVSTGWISSAGTYVPLFEGAFASYCGVRHGIAVCNGTAALHLALVALGVGAGDEILVPDFTMIASATAVCYTGATPVFVDAEERTWNIDPALIEERITERTRAIMVVHIYGHPCAMDEIRRIADRHGLAVIEDAAEAHGAEYRDRRCGSLGDIAAFSFFANKNITTGEGGMVVTEDDELAERCRYYKNLCFPLEGGRIYRHDDLGFNYRMSNLHAAIGLAQVEKADDYRRMRRTVARRYREMLAGIPGLTMQPEEDGTTNVYWMNGLLLEEGVCGISRDGLMKRLRERGIDSRTFFQPLHRQGGLRRHASGGGEYPVTEKLARTGLLLPSGSGLKESQLERICGEIRAAAESSP